MFPQEFITFFAMPFFNFVIPIQAVQSGFGDVNSPAEVKQVAANTDCALLYKGKKEFMNSASLLTCWINKKFFIIYDDFSKKSE